MRLNVGHYEGEPFKVIARKRPAGPWVVMGWTRDPMDAAELRQRETETGDEYAYRSVRNRRTGDA